MLKVVNMKLEVVILSVELFEVKSELALSSLFLPPFPPPLFLLLFFTFPFPLPFLRIRSPRSPRPPLPSSSKHCLFSHWTTD
jgi:hypothetical protein